MNIGDYTFELFKLSEKTKNNQVFKEFVRVAQTAPPPPTPPSDAKGSATHFIKWLKASKSKFSKDIYKTQVVDSLLVLFERLSALSMDVYTFYNLIMALYKPSDIHVDKLSDDLKQVIAIPNIKLALNVLSVITKQPNKIWNISTKASQAAGLISQQLVGNIAEKDQYIKDFIAIERFYFDEPADTEEESMTDSWDTLEVTDEKFDPLYKFLTLSPTIKDKLSDPKTYDALIVLFEKNSSEFRNYAKYFKAFTELYNKYQKVLKPVSNILTKMQINGYLDGIVSSDIVAVVEDSLKIILSAYSSTDKTKNVRFLTDLYNFLLQKFNADIKSAISQAEAKGITFPKLTEFKGKIDQGILAKPFELRNYFKIQEPTIQAYKTINEMVNKYKYQSTNPKEQIYQRIRDSIYERWGFGKQQDLKDMQELYSGKAGVKGPEDLNNVAPLLTNLVIGNISMFLFGLAYAIQNEKHTSADY